MAMHKPRLKWTYDRQRRQWDAGKYLVQGRRGKWFLLHTPGFLGHMTVLDTYSTRQAAMRDAESIEWAAHVKWAARHNVNPDDY